jgi:hypothetical protein
MASSTLVQLIISARDQASSVFRTIGASLGSLGRLANSAVAPAQGLTEQFRNGILQANLYTEAVNQIGRGVAFMNSKFEEAKATELKLVGATGSFAALTGKSFAESGKFVQSFNQDIAKIAGALPGATAEYNQVANSIMDNVIPAFKAADGSLNLNALKSGLVEVTKNMTVLGKIADVPANAVGMFTGRFLSKGQSLAGLAQLQFATDSPAFLGQVKEALKAQKKTEEDFTKMTEKQRYELLKTVSAKFITKDAIDAATNTVDGLLQGIQSAIIDPMTGLFGLMRDLSSAEGSQNVMSAVAGGIKATQKFFESGSNIMKALGVPSTDPMLVLYNGINQVSAWITQVSIKINEVVARPSFKNLASQIQKSVGGLIDGIQKLNRELAIAITTATTFALAKPAMAMGAVQGGLGALTTTATAVGTGILGGVGVASTAVAALGRSIVALPGLAVTAVTRTIAMLNGLAAAIRGVTFSSLATGLQTLATAGWSSVISGLGGAVVGLKAFTLSVYASGVALLTNPLVIGLGAIALAAAAIYKYWKPITAFFRGTISGLLDSFGPLRPAFKGIADIVRPVFNEVGEWIGKAIGWFGNLLKPVEDTNNSAYNLGKTFGESLGGAIKAVTGFLQELWEKMRWVGDRFGGFTNTVVSGVRSIKGIISGGESSSTTPATSGMDDMSGSAFGTSASAPKPVDTSSMFAPANLTPNPTALFNSNLIPSIQNVAPPPTTTSNTSNFAPVLNITTGASDPKEISRVVLDELNTLFGQAQAGLLAP